MELLERYSGNNAFDPFLDCADGSFNFSNVLFSGGDVHNNISIRSYILFSNSMYMSTVCTIMLILEYIFITRFKYLLNCLAVRVGMC